MRLITVKGCTRWLPAAVLVLLLPGCGHAGPGESSSARIVGTVTAGPTCPVERAGSPCPNRPVSGASIQALQNGTAVTSTQTDSTGKFRIAVAPGAYTIVATNAGGYRSTAQRQISVEAGKTATVDLVVDTGIR